MLFSLCSSLPFSVVQRKRDEKDVHQVLHKRSSHWAGLRTSQQKVKYLTWEKNLHAFCFSPYTDEIRVKVIDKNKKEGSKKEVWVTYIQDPGNLVSLILLPIQVIGTTSINVWSLIEQPNMEYRLQPFILKVVNYDLISFFRNTKHTLIVFDLFWINSFKKLSFRAGQLAHRPDRPICLPSRSCPPNTWKSTETTQLFFQSCLPRLEN